MNTNIARPTVAAASLLAALALAASPTAAPAATAAAQSTIKGTVTAFDGKYDLHVQRDDGDVTAVELHQGTIINPTGLMLQPGMQVTIQGVDAGGALDANEIDTPYRITQPAYAPAYGYGGGYGGFYPYGGYDGFYRYGGGPVFGFGF